MNHQQVLEACPPDLQDYIAGAFDWIPTGSQLFGYARWDSDYDFVVYRPEATPEDDLQWATDLVHRSNPEYPDTGQPLNVKVRVRTHDTDLPIVNEVAVNVIVVNDFNVFLSWVSARDLCMLLKREGVQLNKELTVAIHTAKVEQYRDR